MQITINLDTFSFRRAGHVVEVNPENLTARIVEQLVMHGATQKIGDAAAGKGKFTDAAKDAMQSVVDALYAGDWGRARAVGEPAVNRFIRKVMVAIMGEETKKTYADIDADERDAYLDGLYEGLEEEQQSKVYAAAEDALTEWQEEQERKRAAKAKLANALSFNI